MSRTTSLLSQRETMVIDMIIAGERMGAIADKLHIKQSTASTFKKRILQKVHVDNVMELSEWYRKRKDVVNLSVDTTYQIARNAFIELFGEGDLYMLSNVCKNPKTWRRLILEKFANEVDFDDNKSELISRILLWINEENKKHA